MTLAAAPQNFFRLAEYRVAERQMPTSCHDDSSTITMVKPVRADAIGAPAAT